MVRSIILSVIIIVYPYGLKNYLEVTDVTTLDTCYVCKNNDHVWFMHHSILLERKTTKGTACLFI